MKKITTFGLGIVLILSGIIPASEASRDAYYSQAYLGKGKLGKNRHFSDRKGPFRYQIPQKYKRTKTGRRNYWLSHSRYGRKPYLSQYQRKALGRVQIIKNRPELLETKRFETLKRRGYTIDIPSGFRKGKDGMYRNRASSLVFRVVKTPEKYQCVQGSFEFCARDLGKDFRSSQNLPRITNYRKETKYRQTRQSNFLKFPTFTESFKGNLFGSENVYFIFNAFDPRDGSVFRIEAVANARAEKSAAQMMFGVFESFRF